MAAALRCVGGTLGHLVAERAGDRDAGVPAPPLGCATLCRHALHGAPHPEARFLSDVVDYRFERFDDRLGRMEADVKEIKADLKEIDRRLGGEVRYGRPASWASCEQRLARLEGVAANIPSTFVCR